MSASSTKARGFLGSFLTSGTDYFYSSTNILSGFGPPIMIMLLLISVAGFSCY